MSSGIRTKITMSDVLALGIELVVCAGLVLVVTFSSMIFNVISESSSTAAEESGTNNTTNSDMRKISPLPTPRPMPTPTPLPTYGGTMGYVPPNTGRWVVAQYWGYERNYPQQIQYQWVQVQR